MAGFLTFSIFATICCVMSNGCMALEPAVPVLLWSNDGAIDSDADVLAGTTVSVEIARKYMLPLLSGRPRTICLFIQNRLSLDDITKFGNVFNSNHPETSSFHHLKSAMQSAKSSLTLPSVTDTATLKEFLIKTASGKVVELTAKESKKFRFNDHQLDSTAVNVIIAHLPSVPDSNFKETAAAFKKNDKIIHKITEEVAQHSSTFSNIFTGVKPSKDVEDRFMLQENNFVEFPSRVGRQLQEHSDFFIRRYTTLINNHTFFVNYSNCIYLYATDFVFGVYKPNLKVSLLNREPDSVRGSCYSDNSRNTSLELKYRNIDDDRLKYLHIVMNFERTGINNFYWECVNMTVSYDWRTSNASLIKYELYKTQTELMAPHTYSYACNKPHAIYDGTHPPNGSYIKFTNLQIQPMWITNDKFSYASNCVGFFSAPIWMGLVVGLVLITILYAGVLCTMYVKTMDRFDDAKSPGITINISN